MNHIDFVAQNLPEYKNCVAFTLDNVLSKYECQELIRLAESAMVLPEGATEEENPEKHAAWQPALVNMGVGIEMAMTDYRNSDRIVWDRQEVVDLIWQRMKYAEGLEKSLRYIPPTHRDMDLKKAKTGGWLYSRLNDRMRFLRYGPGQYFKPHCDGPYGYSTDDNQDFQTFYTVHLYLNDSAIASSGEEELVGGATSFLSRDLKRRIDVNPKAGSILVFQHKMLYHEGAEVQKGIKYTMRADILFGWDDEGEVKAA